jgi:hypothetical protein
MEHGGDINSGPSRSKQHGEARPGEKVSLLGGSYQERLNALMRWAGEIALTADEQRELGKTRLPERIGQEPQKPALEPQQQNPQKKTDVDLLGERFDKVIKEMDEEGMRFSGGGRFRATMTNLFSWTGDLAGCGEQTTYLLNSLDPGAGGEGGVVRSVPTEAKWTITYQASTWFPHQWLTLTSSNPKDPNIIMDPWLNSFTTEPRGGTQPRGGRK